MKPSRKPPEHVPLRTPAMHAEERRLWAVLDAAAVGRATPPTCARCPGLAQRVVRDGQGWGFQCWDDHSC